MNTSAARVLIIGNGIAGQQTAQSLRALDTNIEITLISAESLHHWSRPSLMYIYMGHIRMKEATPYPAQWYQKKKITCIKSSISTLNTLERQIIDHQGNAYSYDYLVLATGSTPRTLVLPHYELQNVKGVGFLYSIQDLHTLSEYQLFAQSAVVVGGGLVAIELVEMLLSRKMKVHMVIRDDYFGAHFLAQEEAELIQQMLINRGVSLHLSSQISEIEIDENHHISSVSIGTVQIDCIYLGLCIGGVANIDLAKQAGLDCHQGVLVNDYLQTSDPYIFAAGDCIETQQGQQWSMWYTAKAMGKVVAHNIHQALKKHEHQQFKPYQAGTYFNSSRFFDVDFQEFGESLPQQVIHTDSSMTNKALQSLVWQSASKPVMIRIYYRGNTVTGFHCMGTRYRQDYCLQWIEQGYTLKKVIQQLPSACFDPEFTALDLAAIQKELFLTLE